MEELTPTQLIRGKVLELKYKELEEEIKDEWGKLYHNATIHDLPDTESDTESRIFWEDFLSDYIEWGIEDLKGLIDEKYSFGVALHSYGRNGATIAPHNLMTHYGRYSSFGRFDFELLGSWEYDYHDEDLKDRYQEDLKYLEIIKFINKSVREGVKGILPAWEDYKLDHPEYLEEDDDDEEDDYDLCVNA